MVTLYIQRTPVRQLSIRTTLFAVWPWSVGYTCYVTWLKFYFVKLLMLYIHVSTVCISYCCMLFTSLWAVNHWHSVSLGESWDLQRFHFWKKDGDVWWDYRQCSMLLGKCVCRMLIQAPTGVHRGSDCLGFLSLGTSLPQTLPPNPGHVTVCR